MKKIVFTLAAMLSMTLAFAEGENSEKNNAVAPDAAKYEMKININSLSRALRLDEDTKRAVAFIAADFEKDMAKAGSATGDNRARLYKKAVNHNLSSMRDVLDTYQYRDYVTLLKTTISNRGLDK